MRHASDLASVVLAVLPQMAVFTNDSLKEMYMFSYITIITILLKWTVITILCNSNIVASMVRLKYSKNLFITVKYCYMYIAKDDGKRSNISVC